MATVSFSVRLHTSVKTYLFEPRVKVYGRHQQHPQTQCDEANGRLSSNVKRRLSRAVSDRRLRLHAGALDSSIRHDDASLFGYPAAEPQSRPSNLLHQEHSAQHKQEDVSRDVVAALPLPPSRLTGHGRQHLLDRTSSFHANLSLRQLAFAAGPPKTAIDNRRAKEPLRDKEPPSRNRQPPDPGADPPRQDDRGRRLAGGLHEQGEDKGKGDPSPAALDEDDVEDVVLAGKVARDDAGVLVVRLRDVVVCGGADVGRDDGEDCAEDEDCGEDAEGDALEGRGEVWRVSFDGLRLLGGC